MHILFLFEKEASLFFSFFYSEYQTLLDKFLVDNFFFSVLNLSTISIKEEFLSVNSSCNNNKKSEKNNNENKLFVLLWYFHIYKFNALWSRCTGPLSVEKLPDSNLFVKILFLYLFNEKKEKWLIIIILLMQNFNY